MNALSPRQHYRQGSGAASMREKAQSTDEDEGPVTDKAKDDLKGAAYHEAAHAVVGYRLGWVVMEVDVAFGEGKGRTEFYRKCELSFRDRTAMCYAGIVGQTMFKAPTNPRAGVGDFGEVAVLLDGLDATTSEAIRDAGARVAHEILVEYRANVERVAQHLITHRKMDQMQFIQLFVGN